MTNTNPADELRAAANKLRELLAHPEMPTAERWEIDHADPEAVRTPTGAVLATTYTPPTATYMTTMHPGVGSAIADWLHRTSGRAAEVEQFLGNEFQVGALDQDVHDALAVARAINQEQP